MIECLIKGPNRPFYLLVTHAMGYMRRLQHFWGLYPALLYGLASYIGAAGALSPHFFLIVPFLFIASAPYRRLLLALCAATAIYLFVSTSIILPFQGVDCHEEGCWRGAACIEVQDMKHEIRYARQKTVYRVRVQSFQCGPHIFRNFSATMPAFADIHTDRSYSFQALLTRDKKGGYCLRALGPGTQIRDLSFSLVTWRFKAKRAFSHFLAARLPPSRGRTFLEGCISGSLSDDVLQDALWRFGLQHITVVSGFHFSLAAAIVALALGSCLSWRKAMLATLLATTSYLFFVGTSPSVLRAYISIVLCCLAKLAGRKSSGLNSLGVGMLAVILYDPTYIGHLSFQLSFLAAFAILLLYPLFTRILRSWLSCFHVRELLDQSVIDHMAYLLRSWFARSWALILAVNLMVAPLLLYTFQVLPLAGLVYNCFFPFCVSIGIGMLAFSITLCLIPVVSQWMFGLLYCYTEWVLGLILYAPKLFNKALSVEQIPLFIVVASIAVLSFVGMVNHVRDDDAHPMLRWL